MGDVFAQVYFPTISQPEGLPLKVQDTSGRNWTFQFRFWPNNNSRMYVLEGVTPCIQAMQLQAGDTGIVQADLRVDYSFLCKDCYWMLPDILLDNQCQSLKVNGYTYFYYHM